MLQAGKGGALFGGRTPASIPNLKLWLEGNLSPVTIATGVSQWNDRSGLANHFTQGTTTKQPSLISSGINGLPSIETDATDDLLESTAAFNSDNLFAVTQKTIFVVFRTAASIGNFKRIFMGLDTGDGSAWGLWTRSTPAIEYRYQNNAPTNATLTGAALSANTRYVAALRVDGASVKGYLNSLTAVNSAADGRTTTTTSTKKAEIGTGADIRVSALLVYAGAAMLDVNFNWLFRDYLAPKYGVTLA